MNTHIAISDQNQKHFTEIKVCGTIASLDKRWAKNLKHYITSCSCSIFNEVRNSCNTWTLRRKLWELFVFFHQLSKNTYDLLLLTYFCTLLLRFSWRLHTFTILKTQGRRAKVDSEKINNFSLLTLFECWIPAINLLVFQYSVVFIHCQKLM